MKHLLMSVGALVTGALLTAGTMAQDTPRTERKAERQADRQERRVERQATPQVPATPPAAQPAPAVQPAAPAQGNVIEGQVVRVIGNNQVVVRTPDGKETILYTNPQTTYQLNNQPAAFTDFQPGMPVTANYNVQNGRHMVGRIFSGPRRNR